MTDDTKTLAIIRAIDAYSIGSRAAQESGLMRARLDPSGKLHEVESIRSPFDAGVDALIAQLALDGFTIESIRVVDPAS